MQTELNFEQPIKYFNSHSMQPTTNGGIICFDDYLPTGMVGAKEIFMDLETTSCNPELDSLNPWKNCWIAGIAISCDDGLPYYIPVNAQNEQRVGKWLFDIIAHPNLKRWINHNLKYDAHVLRNNLGITVADSTDLICTLTQAKLIDSDRFQHNLTVLSRDWLQEEISEYEQELKPYLPTKGKYKNKDYGRIPIDIIGKYAIQDILTTKKLYKYIQANLPESCNRVRDTEIKLTKALLDIEKNGLRVDIDQLQKAQVRAEMSMLQVEEELYKTTGTVVRPHTNADCFDLLCNYYGLPVLGWTEGGKSEGSKPEPSFDKETLTQYVAHPLAQPGTEIGKVVNLVVKYRKLNTLNNLFIKTFQEKAVIDRNGQALLHPNHNQLVRTGRMSCSNPNAQQNSKSAKELIHPHLNETFAAYDFCIVGSTELITPYGNKTMKQVVDEKLPVLGYTGTKKGLEFCDISIAAEIGCLPCYRVQFADGSYIDCTAEHGFLSRKGERIDCKDLLQATRLAHVYESKSGPYPSLKCSNDEDRLNEAKHILVGRWKYNSGKYTKMGYEFHHIDGNKENWHPDNIELKDIHQHRSDHAVENYEKQDHEYRIEQLRICKNCEQEFQIFPSQQFVTGGNGQTSERQFCNRTCRTEFRHKIPQHRKRKNIQNHQVVSVTPIGNQIVYSLTNPTTHNYVSANGVIHFNSQIEYRMVAHYIENPFLIKSYNDNPDVDYHNWVADMCGVTRGPAKNINFMLSFGGGKGKTVKMLEADMDLVGNLMEKVRELNIPEDQQQAAFHNLASQRAVEVYNKYHNTLPELKIISRKAGAVCAQRGYVFNLYGRQRHLPTTRAHTAFNFLNQSSAADIMKERCVLLHELLQDSPLKICANVHDELLFSLPKELAEDTRVMHTIAHIMEHPDIELLVPIRVAYGTGINWREAGGSATLGKYDDAVSLEKFEQIIRS